MREKGDDRLALEKLRTVATLIEEFQYKDES
jgi:hypothetical protein